MPTPQYELGERIDEIAAVNAGGDHCLTIAIPPDDSVGATLERVEEAHADAEYIHTEEADKALIETLDRAQHLLHRYEESGTPENGLALYVGVVDGELVEYVFDDLPHPVTEPVYEVAAKFDVEPLEGARGESRTYGLLVVERGGAVLGRLDGDRVEHIETIESEVMGKTRAGGQSAQRFERERERQKHEFFQEVAEEAKRAFLVSSQASGDDGDQEPTIDGLLVGGTTVTIDDFLDEEVLDYRLDDLIVGGSYSVEYASDQGLHQLVERAQDALEAETERPTREALDKFFDTIENGDPVAYGREDTEEALEYDAVETLLVSDSLRADEIRSLEEAVEQEGGDVVVIPEGFDRGARFREGFGGIGAILRFPIE